MILLQNTNRSSELANTVTRNDSETPNRDSRLTRLSKLNKQEIEPQLDGSATKHEQELGTNPQLG